MAKRAEKGVDVLSFEDWAEEDTNTTDRLIEDKRKEAKAAAKAVEYEKEYIHKAMPTSSPITRRTDGTMLIRLTLARAT